MLDYKVCSSKKTRNVAFFIFIYGFYTLREKCPHSELFWSVFSHIRSEYGEIRSIFRIPSECRKMHTRITPNTDTFHAATCSPWSSSNSIFRNENIASLNGRKLLPTKILQILKNVCIMQILERLYILGENIPNVLF